MSRTKRKPGLKAQLKRKLAEVDNADGVDSSSLPQRPRLEPPERPPQTVEEVDETISKMDPTLLADHFARQIRKAFPDSSPLELEEKYLPATAFRDTTTFDQPHIAANLPKFLEEVTSGGQKELSTSEIVGSPHTVVITSSGIRTADLRRELSIYQTADSKVPKFIAKHMKLKANINFLAKEKVGIAISTPSRFRDLVKADEKQRTIFEMDELFQPLMNLLNIPELRERYGRGTNTVHLIVF